MAGDLAFFGPFGGSRSSVCQELLTNLILGQLDDLGFIGFVQKDVAHVSSEYSSHGLFFIGILLIWIIFYRNITQIDYTSFIHSLHGVFLSRTFSKWILFAWTILYMKINIMDFTWKLLSWTIFHKNITHIDFFSYGDITHMDYSSDTNYSNDIFLTRTFPKQIFLT